ncbi:hypothetical protein TruAng_001857 [Truncatella angustata]|nr:hypothetical protein TruAng_001857 [Truncatella angustata]
MTPSLENIRSNYERSSPIQDNPRANAKTTVQSTHVKAARSEVDINEDESDAGLNQAEPHRPDSTTPTADAKIPGRAGQADYSPWENVQLVGYSTGFTESYDDYVKRGFYPAKIGEVIKERFKIVHKLGSGDISTVWLVYDLLLTKWRTLKIVGADYPDVEVSEENFKGIMSEQDVSTQMANKMHILTTCETPFKIAGPGGRQTLCLVYPLLGPNLYSILSWSDIEIRQVFREVGEGLQFLHQLGICHADFRTDNLLLCLDQDELEKIDEAEMIKRLGPPQVMDISFITKSADYSKLPPYIVKRANIDHLQVKYTGHAMITDFGAAFKVPNTSTHAPIPAVWAAPEAYFGLEFGLAADVWSLAVTIMEIYACTHIFNNIRGDHKKVVAEYEFVMGTMPEKYRYSYLALVHEDKDQEPGGQDADDLGKQDPDLNKYVSWIHPESGKSMNDMEIRKKFCDEYKQPNVLRALVSRYRNQYVFDPWLNFEFVLDETASKKSKQRRTKPKGRLPPRDISLLGNLLNKVFRWEPADRIDISAVLKHEWFGPQDSSEDTDEETDTEIIVGWHEEPPEPEISISKLLTTFEEEPDETEDPQRPGLSISKVLTTFEEEPEELELTTTGPITVVDVEPILQQLGISGPMTTIDTTPVAQELGVSKPMAVVDVPPVAQELAISGLIIVADVDPIITPVPEPIQFNFSDILTTIDEEPEGDIRDPELVNQELEHARASLEAVTKERDDLKAQHDSALEELGAVRGRKEQLDTQLVDAQSQCQGLKAELEEAQRNIEEHLSDGKTIRGRTTELESSLKEAEGNTENLREELEKVKREFQNLQSKYASKRKENAERAEQLKAATVRADNQDETVQTNENEIKRLEGELAESTDRVGEHEKTLKIKYEEVERIKGELKEATERSDSEVRALRRKENEVEHLKGELKDTSDRLKHHEKTLKTEEEEAKRLRGELEDNKDQAENQKRTLTSKEVEIERLIEALRVATDQVNNHEKDIKKKEKEVKHLEEALKEAEEKSRTLDEELGKAEAATNRTKKELVETQDHHDIVMDKLTAAECQAQSLNKKLTDVEQELQERTNEVERVRRKFREAGFRAESKIQALSTKLEDLSKERDGIVNSLTKSKRRTVGHIQVLEYKILDLERKIKLSTDETEDLKNHNGELEDQNEESVSKIRELEHNAKTSTDEIENLKDRNGKLKHQSGELTTKIRDLEHSVKASNVKIENLKTQNGKLNGQNEKFLLLDGQLKGQKEEFFRQNKDLKGQNAEFLLQNGKFKSQNEEYLQHNAQLTGQNERLLHENEELKGQNDELLYQNGELKGKNEGLLHQNKELKRQSEMLLHQVEDLKKRLRDWDRRRGELGLSDIATIVDEEPVEPIQDEFSARRGYAQTGPREQTDNVGNQQPFAKTGKHFFITIVVPISSGIILAVGIWIAIFMFAICAEAGKQPRDWNVNISFASDPMLRSSEYLI